MDLKDFISQSLTQIMAGVKEAHSNIKGSGGWINPDIRHSKSLPIVGMKGTAHMVEFDVAVTVNEDSKVKGGTGIFVGAVGLGLRSDIGSSDSVMSRIKFNIPVAYPRMVQEKATSKTE